jgi:hypothetical protein
LVFILLAAAGVLTATKLIPPYWTYWSMRIPVKEAAKAAVRPGGEAKARASLLEKAKELSLLLSEENIEVTQEGSTMVVRVTWEHPVDFPGYRHTLHFRLEERESLP